MNNVQNSWLNIFDEYDKRYPNYSLSTILTEISKQRDDYSKSNIDIYPSNENIFKCFKLDFDRIKVVIIGQDPYHAPNQATGLAFGCNIKPPPSLRNIINELKSDMNLNVTDFTLEKWAEQGVLLLNTSLTVIQSKPGSHVKLWSLFTQFVIDKLIECNKPIIFVAWGAHAYNKLSKLTDNSDNSDNSDKTKHQLIVSSHPSPLSAMKPFKQFPPFYGSKPFSKINSLLTIKDKILW